MNHQAVGELATASRSVIQNEQREHQPSQQDLNTTIQDALVLQIENTDHFVDLDLEE